MSLLRGSWAQVILVMSGPGRMMYLCLEPKPEVAIFSKRSKPQGTNSSPHDTGASIANWLASNIQGDVANRCRRLGNLGNVRKKGVANRCRRLGNLGNGNWVPHLSAWQSGQTGRYSWDSTRFTCGEGHETINANSAALYRPSWEYGPGPRRNLTVTRVGQTRLQPKTSDGCHCPIRAPNGLSRRTHSRNRSTSGSVDTALRACGLRRSVRFRD